MSRINFLAAGAITLLASAAVHSAAMASTSAFVENSSGHFDSVNLNTGALTLIGTNASAGLIGLGEIGSTVYGESGSTLYSVNTGTGAVTSLGSASTDTTFVDFGSTTSGLFAIGANGDLFSITTSGAATQVGTGLGLGSSLARASGAFPKGTVLLGLSTGSSTLYLVDGDTLYDINTTTGVASEVGGDGALSKTGVGIGALMVDPSGNLWGGADEGGPGANSDPALLTGVGPITVTYELKTNPNNQHGFQYFGMVFEDATTSSTPEPATWALLLVGFAGLGAMVRLRRRATTA